MPETPNHAALRSPRMADSGIHAIDRPLQLGFRTARHPRDQRNSPAFRTMTTKDITTMIRTTRAAFARYPLFYTLVTVCCPALYLLLLWLYSWGNMPARL